MDARALYRLERIEAVGHTWRPLVDGARARMAASGGNVATPRSGERTSAEESALRASLAAEGFDADAIDELMSDDDYDDGPPPDEVA